MTTTEVIVEAWIQGSSGLAKDRFINVWHFLSVGGADAGALAYTGVRKLCDFYAEPDSGGTGFPVGSFLANQAVGNINFVAYNFADAKPRPELGLADIAYAGGASQDIPEEVALCLSYYTDRNLKSKRGRVYIGPLNVGAVASGGAPPRPHAQFLAAMVDAGTRLIPIGPPASGKVPDAVGGAWAGAVPGPVADAAWALYSPKLGTFAAIEHGWVDNEWDGQSRRRVEASARTSYP